MPEAGQLAVDTPVAPGRVVAGHLQHQLADGRRGTGPARCTSRMSPVPPDEVGVPAQQGLRGDDRAQLAEPTAGQKPGQRGQDGPGQPMTISGP